MSVSEVLADPPAQRRPRFGRGWRLVALGVWTAFLCWVAVKGFLWWRLGVAVTESPAVEAVWRLHYHELYSSGAVTAPLGPDDGSYDVLLLGASVLEQTAPALEQALRKDLDGHVRVFNLARAAHTTRDSYFKCQRLAGRSFDRVIFYDGINDARMNCCADDVFRDDYRHFSWYDSLETRLAAGTVSVSDILASKLNRGSLSFDVASGRQFSDHVKTARAYRQNLESIVDAAERGLGPLLLMTFASDIPNDYSEEAFRAHRLGYGHGKYDVGLDVWGTPTGVRAAIAAHNEVVREVASRHKKVLFVDEDKQMPKTGANFSDPCHFTDQGIATFVEHTLRALGDDLAHFKRAQHVAASASK